MPNTAPAKVSSLLIAAAWVLVAGTAARAANGVIEINQARALAGGVTPGDAPGFPVFLTTSGSYQLTSDLVVSGDTGAILALEDWIAIDLNGFRVQGPTTCTGTGAGLVCSPPGVGHGISGSDHVTVHDGAVVGMSGDGILLGGEYGRIERVEVVGNGGNGIEVGHGGSVRECTVATNGGSYGISAAATDVRVVDNLVYGNRSGGIFTARNGLVRGNVSRGNGGNGIFMVGSGLALGNTIEANGGLGLVMEAEGGYSQNVLTDNVGGTVSIPAVQMGVNVCNGDTTCP